MESSSPSDDSIGARIRQARKALDLNQTALAERLGVTQPAVANWESGVHDPRRLMLAKLAEALGVSLDWLAGGARSPMEADKHPAAAYLRRPVHHAPVIAIRDAALFANETAPPPDPHVFAEDYIPVTTGSGRVFAVFVTDADVEAVFTAGALAVVDYADRRPADGAFCLAQVGGRTAVRRFRAGPARFETARAGPPQDVMTMGDQDRIIGCVRVLIRVF